MVFVLHAEPKAGMLFEGILTLLEKVPRRGFPGGGEQPRQGPPGRTSEARATPPGFCFYAYLFYSVCTDVWVSGRDLGGGKRRWLCRMFESQPSGPSGKAFAFSSSPRGLCAGLLALALAPPVRTPQASPPGPVSPVLPYRLIGSFQGAVAASFWSLLFSGKPWEWPWGASYLVLSLNVHLFVSQPSS